MNDNAPINRRVLLVDDNSAIHNDFRKILLPSGHEPDAFEEMAFGGSRTRTRRAGFEIDSAYQGAEALEKVGQAQAGGRHYAVAFIDMLMPPGWDGVETAVKLWEKDPELHVVMCTAYSQNSWGETLERLGHSDRLLILKKPFDPVEVLQLAECLTQKWDLLWRSKTRMATLRQKVAERTAQIVHEQARYKAIFDNTPIGIFQTSPEGRILCANPAFAQLAGYCSGEEMAAEITSVGAQLYAVPDRRKDFKRLMERDRFVRDFEFELKCKDGSTKWVSLTGFAVTGQDGTLEYYEGFLYDLTVRRKAEQERQQMEIQLRQAQKMESIGQLAAGIAHEINTPTQYVGDNIRFLADSFACIQRVFHSFQECLNAAKTNDLTPARLADAAAVLAAADPDYLCAEIPLALEQTQEGVSRISKIVKAMKEFSHPGGQQMAAVDLNHAIETTVMVARNEWKYVAEMNLELEPGLPPVTCFVNEFNQAILNLVVNAAHAIGDVVKERGGAKGTISLRTRRHGEEVEIRISDTGAGIPEAIRSRIFEPFFTTKEVGKGTGQGLTVVYNSIVKQHGGTVSFETEVGKGTTFIVRLPISATKKSLPLENGLANN
jgi:PAS domain S-box-containing protein